MDNDMTTAIQAITAGASEHARAVTQTDGPTAPAETHIAVAGRSPVSNIWRVTLLAVGQRPRVILDILFPIWGTFQAGAAGLRLIEKGWMIDRFHGVAGWTEFWEETYIARAYEIE